MSPNRSSFSANRVNASYQASFSRATHFLHRVSRRQVNDVGGHTRHLGERDRAACRFGFGGHWAGQRMPLGLGVAFFERALDEGVDDAAVFRVHADESAVVLGAQHRFENRGVVDR